jgi:hypothetical protein
MLNRNHYILMKMYEKRFLKTIKEKVLIRDILVTQDRLDDRQNRVGEFHSTLGADESEDAFAKRIMLHIKKMVSIATEIHLNDNFTANEKIDYTGPAAQARPRTLAVSDQHKDEPEEKEITAHTMKVDCKNNVTRLSFNEYYFYPGKKRGPLSFDTLKNFTIEIEKLASQLPENLHLVLASLPVVDLKKQVSNMVIHVQCGEVPVIHMFAKAIISNNEPAYPDTKAIEFCAHAFNPISRTALGPDANENGSINFSSPILCETFGGAKFWAVIDICAEHELGIAKQALNREIAIRIRDQSQNIPELITHVVVSNSTFLYDENILSATVTHVDPTYHTLHNVSADKKWEPSMMGQTNCIVMTGTNTENTIEVRCFPQREMDILGAGLLKSVQIYNKHLAIRQALTQKITAASSNAQLTLTDNLLRSRSYL